MILRELGLNVCAWSWGLGETGIGHYAIDAPASYKWDGQVQKFRMNIANNLPAEWWNAYLKMAKNSYAIIGARLYHKDGYVIHLNVETAPQFKSQGETTKDGNFVFSFSAKAVGTINDEWLKSELNRIEILFLCDNEFEK